MATIQNTYVGFVKIVDVICILVNNRIIFLFSFQNIQKRLYMIICIGLEHVNFFELWELQRSVTILCPP